MDGLAVSCMRWRSHAVGVLANLTLEVTALPVVLSDLETAVENLKA
jgi:hypothetical protein